MSFFALWKFYVKNFNVQENEKSDIHHDRCTIDTSLGAYDTPSMVTRGDPKYELVIYGFENTLVYIE